uniref:Uncharacterized protein n=1 Tax=Manihot esculenta TaxID=3983 RepID=A0A2C9WEV6_MANES
MVRGELSSLTLQIASNILTNDANRKQHSHQRRKLQAEDPWKVRPLLSQGKMGARREDDRR